MSRLEGLSQSLFLPLTSQVGPEAHAPVASLTLIRGQTAWAAFGVSLVLGLVTYPTTAASRHASQDCLKIRPFLTSLTVNTGTWLVFHSGSGPRFR